MNEELKKRIRQLITERPMNYGQCCDSKGYEDLRREIMDATPLLACDFYDFKTRIFWILHDITDFPRCCVCGRNVTRNVRTLKTGYNKEKEWGKSDVSKLQTKSKNKIRHELLEINHRILRLCKAWHCGKLSCEDLKFDNKKKFWDKKKNRKCRNQFRFGIIKSHLQTLCNTYGVDFIEVNAAYSSIIGNFVHGSATCPDMVAASIEIARRAYRKFEKGWFQPKFVSEQRIQQVLGNQWKEELMLDYMSWKGLAGIIKKSKLKYRFQLDPSNAVFSKTYLKNFISDYKFL